MQNNKEQNNQKKLPKAIILFGQKENGKDTVAEMITDYYKDKSFQIIGFADSLKRGVAALFDVPDYQVINMSQEEKNQLIPGFNFTWRRAMQEMNSLKMGLGEDLYVNITKKIIEEYQYSSIIKDGRFIVENKMAKENKENGYYSVNVIRPSKINNDPHRSESELIDRFNEFHFDYIIINDGNLNDLRNKVSKMCEQWGG